MRPMKVRWQSRVIAAAPSGEEFSWLPLDSPPDDEVVALCVRHSAAVRVTFPDGSAIEYAVEGVTDAGPNEARSHRY